MYIPNSFLVSLDIVKATKVITFNAAAELNLGPATLLVASSSVGLSPVETKFDAGTQRASLIFAEDLPVGSKATLRVAFESALTDSMTGYYKSTWEKGTYALTQFEVRVLPVRTYALCWIRHLLSVPTSKWWSQSPGDSTCIGCRSALGPMTSV